MEFSQSRFDRILVPLDGSQVSEQALSYARSLIRSTTEVTLLQVIPRFEPVHDLQDYLLTVIDKGRHMLHRRASDELRRAADRLQTATGARVQTAVADGDPAMEILSAATERGIGLIVMAAEGFGTSGQGGLGSVADRVARAAQVPVFIVRNRTLTAGIVSSTVRRLVVPLDGSDRAAAAVAVAEDLALRMRVQVLLLSVIDATAFDLPEYVHEAAYDKALYRDLSADASLDAQRTLDRVGARLIRHQIGMHSMLLSGPVATTIMCATTPGDIIVMTNRGRGGGRTWPLGSVAERLIASGPVPVVLVPTGQERAIGAPIFTDVFRQVAIGAT